MPQRNKWIRNAVIVLMAVAIVVWVSAYGMPRIREIANQRTCAGNLKRLGEACAMYQTDWHDVLVPYGAPFAWQPKPGMWPELLEPYLCKILGSAEHSVRVSHVFVCPSAIVEEEDPAGMRLGYGMNERCGGWFPKELPIVIALKSVKYPGMTIRLAEAIWKAQGGSSFAAKPSDFKSDEPYGHMFAARHMGKGNVLWIDGHVLSMTLAQYNMRDKGPYDGNIWLRLEGPKPPLP